MDEGDECLFCCRSGGGQEGAALKAVFAAEFGAKYSKDGTPRVRVFAGASLVKSQACGLKLLAYAALSYSCMRP